jgi:hypothetical protein
MAVGDADALTDQLAASMYWFYFDKTTQRHLPAVVAWSK